MVLLNGSGKGSKMTKIDRELMRGAGPVAVLKLLESGEKYGYELVESLAVGSDGVLDMGQSTLYPLLYNLEARGLVRARWRENESPRPRKYYALTAKGKKRLAHDVAQWKAVAKAMQSLGILKPALGGATG
jgi:PadR family transcriptional regulator PadR